MNQKFTPTLRQLRAFAAVYQLRKLSAAAEQLSLTQSAVSVLIRQIEQGLGARLFDRTTRSLAPTQAARDFEGKADTALRMTGGGPKFLNFMKSELIPHIDAMASTRIFMES